EKYKRDNVRFSQSAYNQMLNYTWRGNVRELQHVIERAILLSRGSVIENLDIKFEPSASNTLNLQLSQPESAAAATAGNGGSNGSAMSPAMPEFNFRPATPTSPLEGLSGDAFFEEIGKLVVDSLEEPAEGTEQNDVFNNLESGVVLAALKRTRGNKQAAANLLGLYRP